MYVFTPHPPTTTINHALSTPHSYPRADPPRPSPPPSLALRHTDPDPVKALSHRIVSSPFSAPPFKTPPYHTYPLTRDRERDLVSLPPSLPPAQYTPHQFMQQTKADLALNHDICKRIVHLAPAWFGARGGGGGRGAA